MPSENLRDILDGAFRWFIVVGGGGRYGNGCCSCGCAREGSVIFDHAMLNTVADKAELQRLVLSSPPSPKKAMRKLQGDRFSGEPLPLKNARGRLLEVDHAVASHGLYVLKRVAENSSKTWDVLDVFGTPKEILVHPTAVKREHKMQSIRSAKVRVRHNHNKQEQNAEAPRISTFG